MKKLLTVSLLAMMAVGTARADIASTNYVDTVAKNKADAAQAAAEATAASNLSTTIAGYSTTEQMNAAIKVETDRATNAETALGARIDNISAGELTIKENAVTAKEIKNGEVKTDEIADSAVTTAKIANDAVTTVKILDKNVTADKLSDDVKALFDAAGAAATAKSEAIEAAAADATSKADAAQAAAISAAAQAVTNAGYQTKSNIHTTGELTGAELDTKYPSVGYVDTAVAGVDANLDGLKTTVAGHTSKIEALEGTVGDYGDIVTKNIADFDASGAAAQALADAKGYTDTLANGAVKANTDHIGVLGSLTTTAKGNLVAAINEADGEAADAQADATKALADAAAAQGTADDALAGYESIEAAAEATGTNYGTFALTMKKDQSGNVTYLWENIGR